MRKIGFTPKIVAYASSMVLSIGIFGSYNMLLSVTPSNVPEIPVINLDTISPVISSTDYAESANPFGTISVTGAGAGVARMGMGGTQGVSTPTPPGVPPMPFTPRSEGFEGNVGVNYTESNEVNVIGVLPPDVVVLGRGNQTVTARSGSDTAFGTVGAVTVKGAYVDGNFIALK